MSNSKIEWTDKTWNPVTGCTKVSQGCKNCYAERLYERFHGHNSFKQVICHEDRLSIPLKWRQPAMVFVNSMSDLFHEDVPFIFIDAVFRVMADQDQHIYQVLTKRPERMHEFYKWKFDQMKLHWRPKDNVWIGVSVEDQKTAEERVLQLLQFPAAVHFLSVEPMLGQIDLEKILGPADPEDPTSKYFFNALHDNSWEVGYDEDSFDSVDGPVYGAIDWVICGGESGPRARPMYPDWPRSLRDQCIGNDIPFFFKQWGEYINICLASTEQYDQASRSQIKVFPDPTDPDRNLQYLRLGKSKTGRMLDGKEHNGMPVATGTMQ